MAGPVRGPYDGTVGSPVAGETDLYRGASVLVAGREMEPVTAATPCHPSGAGGGLPSGDIRDFNVAECGVVAAGCGASGGGGGACRGDDLCGLQVV